VLFVSSFKLRLTFCCFAQKRIIIPNLSERGTKLYKIFQFLQLFQPAFVQSIAVSIMLVSDRSGMASVSPFFIGDLIFGTIIQSETPPIL
jgi:hypothetical protein